MVSARAPASGWGAIAEPARIEIRWRAGEAWVIADPRRLLRAFDNLIANALEHGTPPVTLSASIVPSGVQVAVADGGPLERRPGLAFVVTSLATPSEARFTGRLREYGSFKGVTGPEIVFKQKRTALFVIKDHFNKLLMFKMPKTGEQHRYSPSVAGIDHFVVIYRTTVLYYGSYTILRGNLDRIGFWKKCVRREK